GENHALEMRGGFLSAVHWGSRHQAMEYVAIDIAAGEHRDRDLALDIDLARHQHGERDRAARLDHELQSTERKSDRARDLVLARAHALAHERAIDRKGELAGRARHQGIADSAGR